MIVLLLYGGLLYLTYREFERTPSGFIPTQDKGYLLVNVQMPDSTSLEKTQQVMQRVEAIAMRTPGVKHTVAIAGQSILLNANAPNFGAMYVMLDEFHHRTTPRAAWRGDPRQTPRPEMRHEIIEGLVNIFNVPPVEGLGTAGGFKVVIEDRGDSGMDALQETAERAVADGNGTPGLTGMFTSFRANTPVAVPEHRPRQGQRDGREHARSLQHLAGLPRVALRQRLQPLRADLAGQRPGRLGLPHARSTT